MVRAYLLDEVRDTHRDTDEYVDSSQDPSSIFCRVVVLATSFVENPGSVVHMLILGPCRILFVIVFDMFDRVPVLFFERRHRRDLVS